MGLTSLKTQLILFLGTQQNISFVLNYLRFLKANPKPSAWECCQHPSLRHDLNPQPQPRFCLPRELPAVLTKSSQPVRKAQSDKAYTTIPLQPLRCMATKTLMATERRKQSGKFVSLTRAEGCLSTYVQRPYISSSPLISVDTCQAGTVTLPGNEEAEA